MGRGRAYLSIVVMAIAASAATTPPALTVTTRARAVQPGELILFTILAAQPVSQVTVRAFGRDWPAYEDGSARRWRAPVGIDLDTRPATYHAEIAAGEDRTSYPLVVRARAFRTRHLTVNPDLVNPPQGCRFAPRCRYAQERCQVEEPPLTPTAEDPRHIYACWYPVGSPEYKAIKASRQAEPIGAEAAA